MVHLLYFYKNGVYTSIRWPLNSFLKKYTENHHKSQNVNIFLLTSAIFRGLRSVFFKPFFFIYQKYIRELQLRKYSVISFFSKIIPFFLGVDCGVNPPPKDNFYLSPTQDRVKECGEILINCPNCLLGTKLS